MGGVNLGAGFVEAVQVHAPSAAAGTIEHLTSIDGYERVKKTLTKIEVRDVLSAREQRCSSNNSRRPSRRFA